MQIKYKYKIGDVVIIRGDGLTAEVVKRMPPNAKPGGWVSYRVRVPGRGVWARYEHELAKATGTKSA